MSFTIPPFSPFTAGPFIQPHHTHTFAAGQGLEEEPRKQEREQTESGADLDGDTRWRMRRHSHSSRTLCGAALRISRSARGVTQPDVDTVEFLLQSAIDAVEFPL